MLLVFKKKQRYTAVTISKGDLYLCTGNFLFSPFYLLFSTVMCVVPYGPKESRATGGHGRSSGFVSEKGSCTCVVKISDYEDLRRVGLG